MHSKPRYDRPRATRRAPVLLLALTGVLACGGDGGTDPGSGGGSAVAQVALSVQDASVGIGRTLTLEAQALNAAGSVVGGGASWSSVDPSIATVAGGVVTGRAIGTTEIRATVGGATSRATITVGEPVGTVDIVTAAPAGMPVGATLTLRAAAADASGATLAGRQVTWSGGDAAVARLDARAGTLTAVASGTTRLIASSEGRADTVEIRVIAPPVMDRTMAAMRGSSCALTTLGEAWCWGNALGENSTTNINVVPGPRRAGGGLYFRSITAGETHACGLGADSLAYCWGDPSLGRLGDAGAIAQYAAPVWEPVRVAGDHRFVAISAGASWTLGLTADGRLYAWGDNTGSHLGDGTQTHRSTPVAVGGALRFRLMDAGQAANTAISTANQIYTWGAGSATPTLTPGQDVARVATLVTLSAAGGDAIGLTQGGELWGWQLGYYNTSLEIGSQVPVRLQAAYTFRRAEVSEGQFITAITTGGALVSWGSAYRGYLGNGQQASSMYDSPMSRTPVAPSGGRSWTDFAAGYEHVAALDATGAVWHWGFSDRDGDFATGERYGIYSTPRAPVAARIVYDEWNPAPSLTLVPGQRDSVSILVRRTGGSFRRSGAGVGLPRRGTATILGLPAGVTATIEPRPVNNHGFEFDYYVIRVSAASNITGGTSAPIIDISAPGAEGATIPMALQLDAPPGPALNLVCTTGTTPASFPAGYHCMTNPDGEHVPGFYGAAELSGNWVEESYGVCVSYDISTGTATARFKAGLGGGSTTVQTGRYGYITRRDGTPEQAPNGGRYLFTGSLDAQTMLMVFYPSSRQFSGGNFTRGSCAW